MKKILVLFFLCLLFHNVFSQFKFNYPVKPGSEKWKSFTTHAQMIEACKIPEPILSEMTTNELLEAWENFPLKIDVFAFNSTQRGFEIQKKICKALDLLLKKTDVGDVVLKHFKEAKSVESLILGKKYPKISILDYRLLRILVSQSEVIEKITKEEDKEFLKNELGILKSLKKSTSSLDIWTPRYTPVPNIIRSDGTDDPIDPKLFDAEEMNKSYKKTYPLATFISSSTRTYNCHSYAWANGYINRCWINMPDDQLYFQEPIGDGSYDEVSETIATKVSYSGDHSAVTTTTAGIYRSKWGEAPLMQHAKDYCPQGYGSATQFFRRSVDVPQDQSSINSAVLAAVSGQTIIVTSGSYTLTSNITVPAGVTLLVKEGSNLYFQNGAQLIVNGMERCLRHLLNC